MTAALPPEEQQVLRAEDPEWAASWDPEHGDRVTELVFIGIGLDQEAIVKQLDACLLTDEEYAADWSRLPDPLPTSNVVVETVVEV